MRRYMEITSMVLAAVVAVTLVAFGYTALQNRWKLANPKSNIDDSPVDKDAMIREIATSIVAIVIVLGCLYLLAFVPQSPHDIVALALGAILAFYFTKNQVAAKP